MLRLLLALFLGLALAPAVMAASDQDRAREAVRSGAVRPLGEILSSVRRNHPGRVLDADIGQGGGRWFYDIRLLGPGGQITDLRVDAGSAEVLNVRRGRRGRGDGRGDDRDRGRRGYAEEDRRRDSRPSLGLGWDSDRQRPGNRGRDTGRGSGRD